MLEPAINLCTMKKDGLDRTIQMKQLSIYNICSCIKVPCSKILVQYKFCLHLQIYSGLITKVDPNSIYR